MRFLRGRLLDLVVVLFGVSILTFLMIRLIPGDAVAIMLGANTEVTPERIAEMRAALGLDRPLIAQYAGWLGGALTGDLGVSIWTRRPVIDEIAAHVWPTLQLATLAPRHRGRARGAARRADGVSQGRGWDVALQVGSVAGLTIPSFWLGIMLILLLSALAPEWQLLGYVPFSEDPLGNLTRLALPAFCLALPILANLARLVRSAMLDALQQDYIRSARARGASEASICSSMR